MKLIPVCGLVVASVLVVGAGELRVPADAKQVSVSIVRRVDVAYNVVTRAKPLEFDATGPTWLRVYTRLWWPAGKTGKVRYRLALGQDEAERPVEFDVGISPSSFGPRGRKLAQWRSFFIQVPAGSNHYRLAIAEAPGDTLGVRIVEQPPRPWQAVAITGVRSLTFVEGRDTSRLFELGKGQSVPVELIGPCRVRVRARLDFDPSMNGVQGFVMTATEGKVQLGTSNLRAGRSPAAVYLNEPAVVPSSERTLRFSLPEGRHDVVLQLGGTLAKSAAVRVEMLPGEKYE